MKNNNFIFNKIKFTGILAAASLGSLGVALGADAATLTYTASYPGGGGTTSTNFINQPVAPNLPQFDASLGTLQSIKITLTGLVAGTARVESLDASPATININQSAAISFNVTGYPTSPLIQVIPITSQVFNASAFDNSIDFGGTSGASFTDLTASATDSVTLTLPAQFAPFIGTGNIAGLLTGTGASSATGSGNVITNFLTQAGGTVEIEYTYSTPDQPTTPEPATLLGLATVAGIGLLSRKKA